LGVDLGTANTVVWHARRGIILNEPWVMALQNDGAHRRRLLAVRQEARALVGRRPRA
jgi:rod shape-determining protein MreB